MSDPLHLGPALAFDLHESTAPPTGDWQDLTARLSTAALRRRVDQVRDALTIDGRTRPDARTAASTEQFGLVARLVAAHLCATALGHPVDLHESAIHWRLDGAGWLQLSFALTGEAAKPLRDSAITVLTRRIEQLYGVSAHVLWGNVGSAANSTITLLRAARPDLVEAARAAADELLADPLIDRGQLRAGPGFRRASCCLVYRATGSLCGDCVLHARDSR